MDYNKNGEVDRYYNLDDILKLDLPDEAKSNFEDKFGKLVFFDSNGSCRMGTLCGLEKNQKLSMLYYIVKNNETKLFVPIWESLTRV